MAERVETVSIASEVRDRFLRYAMSVVTGRALPDVRDGLKPVQRRILFGMYNDKGLTFDKKSAKSAQIVGQVMGDYHPHGDGALYDAMVRLAQGWVMRVPLVHGDGNFGSVDGDPPAAMRYTEAKLTRAAETLLEELDHETVEMRDNYTGTRQEPVVLPAQFPNLLVNGTSGIAVGMATNIPPHNLGEVLRACILLIDQPEATTVQLLEKIKGPDFPLGGKIVTDRATLRRIYEEGTGSIKVQGEWKLEELARGRQQIVITSIPYGVDKGALENHIGGIAEERKLPQLLGVANESNEKEGMRIVLDIKTGTDPALVLAYLYRHTELQKNFAYNMTALVPSTDARTMTPRDGLSLREILRYFLDYRLETVRRRFEFQLRQLRKRIHILEAFAIIFDALDEAIQLIRTSSGKPDAAVKLKNRFQLDDEQTNAVLDSQLYKIAQMEILKIREELAEKRKAAETIEQILASEQKLWGVIRGELEALSSKDFVTRRKTRMAGDEDVLEFHEDAYITRENTNIVLTRDGWIKRVGRLASVESTRVRDGDEVLAVVPASTLDCVVFFADDGTAYTMRANEVPASSGYGEPITKFFKLADQVRIIAALGTDPRFTPPDGPVTSDSQPTGPFLLVVTSAGFVVRLPLTAYRGESTKSGRRYVRMESTDKVVSVRLLAEETGVMLATKNGQLIHFPISQIPTITGVGKGVIGIKLQDGDYCLGAALINGRFSKMVVETDAGKQQEYGPGAFPPQNRGGKGERVGARTRFARVIPSTIELPDWDNAEGRVARLAPARDEANSLPPTTAPQDPPSLF